MLSDAIHICLNYTEIRESLSVDHLMQHSLIGRSRSCNCGSSSVLLLASPQVFYSPSYI